MEPFYALLAICAGNSLVPVNSPHKGQWHGALVFSLIAAWINGWVNNREAGDLRRNRGHYDVIVMRWDTIRDQGLTEVITWIFNSICVCVFFNQDGIDWTTESILRISNCTMGIFYCHFGKEHVAWYYCKACFNNTQLEKLRAEFHINTEADMLQSKPTAK